MELIVGIAVAIAIVILLVVVFVTSKKPPASAATPVPPPASAADPREERIESSAQIVRGVFLQLADSIRRLDSAADSSTATLDASRGRVCDLRLDKDLQEAQAVLLAEIDRVIQSNATLRSDLAQARTTLQEQQKQIDSLQTAVRIDSLTELGNRAAFFEKLKEAAARYRRDEEKFSLLMIDLDHFKHVNDTYGHVAGDKVLADVAKLLRSDRRETDSYARYGGEEFAAVLVKTDRTGAAALAKELRARVKASRFAIPHQGKSTAIRITVSIGVASMQPQDTVQTLLTRADTALYRAKQNGRDQVCVETDEEIASLDRKSG